MDHKSQTRQVYDSGAAVIAEKFNSGGPRVKDIALAFAYVQKENPVVFEIGCGNGRDAKEILKRTTHYYGIDYSEGLLNIARTTVPEASFELADIEHYDLPKGIDIIFAFASLLHSDMDAVKKVLNDAHQALTPGGVFFLSLKSAPYKQVAETDAWGTRTFFYYTRQDIKELIGEHYHVVYENDFVAKNGVLWFEMILQK